MNLGRIGAPWVVGLSLAGCGAAPGYDDPSDISQPEPAHVARVAAPSAPFAVGQTWVGSYVCAQGETELALHIVDVDGRSVRAIFDFRHEDSGASGAFEVQGAWSARRQTMTLDPVRWLKRPPNYVMVALEGGVSVGGHRFVGQVSGPGCSRFSLKLARGSR